MCLLKKIAIQCGFVIAFLCSFQAVVNAAPVLEQLNSNSVKRDQSESICYLPTESNVRYQDVLALPTESPKHVLSYGAQQFQFGELWLPNDNRVENRKIESSDPLIRHPLVVLVHGGCWLNSFDIKHTHALSTALKGAGYAVWSLEYRRTGDAGGGWPGTYADIKLAIEYLPELADFPVDLNKIAIAGHSAGGHLALLAASEQIYDFDAVIGLASIVDIERYALGDNSCQVATPAFMGGSFETKASAYNQANPAKLQPHSKTVLIHGSLDKIVDPSQASYLDVEAKIIEGAGHFDMLHPGTQSYQALLKELARAFK